MPSRPRAARSTPDLAVVQRDIESLAAYADNARVHSVEQVRQIARAIREFGFVVPIIIDEGGEIVAGHGRLLAARSLKLKTVPCVVVEGWSEGQKRAYRIADNKLAENSTWDSALLIRELQTIGQMGFDLTTAGFTFAELADLLPSAGTQSPPGAGSTHESDEPDPDDAEVAVPKVITTIPGDIWALGDHRLICGDSTDPAVRARLFGDARASLLFTSPPYGNQRAYTTGGISDWDRLMKGVFGGVADVLTDDAQVLVNLGMIHREGEWMPYWSDWVEWMRTQEWRRFGLYVWDQGPGMPGDWNGRLGPAFEFVFHFNQKPKRPNKIVQNAMAGGKRGGGTGMRSQDGTVGKWWGGDTVSESRIPDSVIRIGRAHTAGRLTNGGGHPAVFPVRLPAFIMEAYCASAEVVFEPFSGSGTTIIAGQRAGRRVMAIELAPEYVDLTIARWQAIHPDIPVIHAETGCTFDVVQADRTHASAKAEETALPRASARRSRHASRQDAGTPPRQ